MSDAETARAIARDIRRELVCCHVYDRDADTEYAGEEHAICFWGEAAARIAESHANPVAALRMVRLRGAEDEAEAEKLSQWARANGLDPAKIDGTRGIEVHYDTGLLWWHDYDTWKPMSSRMLVEPVAEMVAELGGEQA